MKGFFISVSMILVFFVAHVQVSAQHEAKNRNNDSDPSAISEIQHITSGESNLFNREASEENGECSLESLFPKMQSFFQTGFPLNKYAELKRKSEISTYEIYAEWHISRREGADIIHPFDYFS